MGTGLVLAGLVPMACLSENDDLGEPTELAEHQWRDASDRVAFGEVGHVDGSTHETMDVQLRREYDDPVVLVSGSTNNGSDPVVPLITEVWADAFSVRLEEPHDHDGVHTGETLSYFVLEPGEYEIGGQRVVVGYIDLADDVVGPLVENDWHTVHFAPAFAEAPALLTSINGLDGCALDQFASTRVDGLDGQGFKVAVERAEDSTIDTTCTRIAYVAIEPGYALIGGGGELVAGFGSVNSNPTRVSWLYPVADDPPEAALSLASYNGGNPVHLRVQSGTLDSTGVDVFLEEDTTLDAETDHVPENVSYLVVSGKVILRGYLL